MAGILYDFHAQQPQHIVSTQIRRHCQGIDCPSAAPTKHFRLVQDNKFIPLEPPVRVRYRTPRSRPGGNERGRCFAKALFDVYGFVDTKVTSPSGDGGIDGHGKLKVGLAYLNVAFQCKRWRRGNIQRTAIDRFRGAIQGDYEQGIFFATTSFSQGAIDASIKRGAVPIVLIDVTAIVRSAQTGSLANEDSFGKVRESWGDDPDGCPALSGILSALGDVGVLTSADSPGCGLKRRVVDGERV